MKTPLIKKITIGRLYNLGSYEHVRYELTAEVHDGASAKQVFLGLERILEGLNPGPLRTMPTELEIKREEARLLEAEAMTDEQFRDWRNYRNYAGTREEILQRLRDGIREAKEKRSQRQAIATDARTLFDDLGGAATWKDAKLAWEDANDA